MLRPGELARIHGLQSQTALNGCEVRLLNESEGGRWAVMCPSGKTVKVKPQNLEAASAGVADNPLQAFAARLRPQGGDEYSTFAAADLLEATRAEIKGSSVKLVDRSGQLLVGSSDLVAVMPQAGRVVASLLGEASSGKTLVYLQRTRENSDAFAATFALLKHSSSLQEGGQQPISFLLPGWIALHRDDFFFAAPTYSLTLSCRVLANFANGGGECCICCALLLCRSAALPSPLPRSEVGPRKRCSPETCVCFAVEHIYNHGPSTGLDCGHVIHEACLRQCIAQGGPTPCCPLCREPMQLRGGTSMDPRQETHDVATRQDATPLDVVPPAQHVDVEAAARTTTCCCIC